MYSTSLTLLDRRSFIIRYQDTFSFTCNNSISIDEEIIVISFTFQNFKECGNQSTINLELDLALPGHAKSELRGFDIDIYI
jgi:hypothetical protein